MQIDRNNYGTMLFMSKRVSLPKISSMLQKMKIGQNSIHGLFARSPSIKSFKAGTKHVIGLHSYYSNMASGSDTIKLLTVSTPE